jgi:hypothetical protein
LNGEKHLHDMPLRNIGMTIRPIQIFWRTAACLTPEFSAALNIFEIPRQVLQIFSEFVGRGDGLYGQDSPPMVRPRENFDPNLSFHVGGRWTMAARVKSKPDNLRIESILHGMDGSSPSWEACSTRLHLGTLHMSTN